MSEQDEYAVEWGGHTHHHIERSVDWFWTLGLVALVTAGIAAWFGDALFSTIIIISSIMIGVVASRPPKELFVRIDNDGVHLEQDSYSYKTIQSFWIRTEFIPSPRLHLLTTDIIHADIAITIPDIETAEQVGAILVHHGIPEEEHHTGGTILADLMGF